MYATSGQIGGWNINSSTLTGGNMTINSNGSMSGSNWSIGTNGYARFTDVYISNGNTSLSSTAKMIDIGNFYVTAGGEMHASSGSIAGKLVSSGINASNITGGSLSMNRISGGTLNVGANGGYLRVGVGYVHPAVSGLNVDGGGTGIAMNGAGISNIGSLNMNYEGNIYPTRTVFNLGIRDQNGGVHHFTFIHGILSAWNYDKP